MGTRPAKSYGAAEVLGLPVAAGAAADVEAALGAELYPAR